MSHHRVSELYGRHEGADIYVVGAGASMRVFPGDYLADKITIGLNMAWKNAPIRYGITIHPDLNVPEFMPGEAPRPEITWITKLGKARSVLTPEHFTEAEARFFFFESKAHKNTALPWEPSDAGRWLDWVRAPHGDDLYQWSSISQTAVNLAANMGAKTIILVGCDNGSILGNHHAHQQHTRWKGVDPAHRYRQYYDGLVEVRQALRERGVDLISLSPFASLLDPETDFRQLCEELDRPELLRGEELEVPEAKVAQDEAPQGPRGAAAPAKPGLVASAFSLFRK